MNEYRRSTTLTQDTDYWFVVMGPIPNMPDWHMSLYAQQSYAFPSEQAARRFAMTSRERDWDRDISIKEPDGNLYKVPFVGEEDWQ